MAFYGDGDDVWRCPLHPSKRRRIGICALCLRDRLLTLCPHCANVRPCNCCAAAPTTTTSSSSSSSSSFSRFSSADTAASLGSVGRLSNLIDVEPPFRRSRSLAAIPFLRSRSRFLPDSDDSSSAGNTARASSIWSIFRSRSKKSGGNEAAAAEFDCRRRSAKEAAEVEEAMRLIRSRSVAVSDSDGRFVRPSTVKARAWYFPSPLKAFRQSKVSQQTPILRG